MIDLKTIDENLAKAKEDVAFWEKARVVFLDPRITQAQQSLPLQSLPVPFPIPPAPRPYGEVKRRVLAVLPERDQPGLSTAELADRLTREGFVFVAKVPSIAVNEALRSLLEEGKAVNAGMRGISKLWTKGYQEDRKETTQ